jgi:restriction system protein
LPRKCNCILVLFPSLINFAIIKHMEFIFVIVFIIFLYYVLRKKSSNTTDDLNVKKLLDIMKINKKRHACKCYMEELTLGEQKVADTLARELSYKDYFLFNNIIINSKNNKSTQIDHIIVSKFGIFVIENKNYAGWIFGSKNESNWTQSMPGAVKFKFQNPIRQNYGHMMALKELMPFAKDNFFNIVVFTGDGEIKTDRIENVLYLNELIDYIKKYTQEKLSENEIQFAIGKLSYSCQTINTTIEEHIVNIHSNKNYQRINQYNQRSFGTYFRT